MKRTNGLDQLADIQHIAKDYADEVSGFLSLDSDKPSLIISSFLDLHKCNIRKDLHKIGDPFDSG